MRALIPLPFLLLAACSSGDVVKVPQRGPRLPVTLPAGFRLGAGTIAYQSEGTVQSGGKRVHSNWSEWEDLGMIDGQTNPYGNGFFAHPEVDLDLAAGIGSNAFSYSVDWARVEPEPGVFDAAEIDRVVHIVELMRARGLRPMIILFHWVTPYWVQSPQQDIDLLNRDDQAFVDAFLPMVDKVVPRLAGLVDDWVTFEEPVSIVGAEYLTGEHPPGKTLDMDAAGRALVNLMFLNARTYHRVHALDKTDSDGDGVAAWVGFENISLEFVPLDPNDPLDVAAAKRVDYIANHQFLTGVYYGDIDLDMDGAATNTTTVVPERHVKELERTVDFIGINYYQRARVSGHGPYAALPPLYATPYYDVRELKGVVADPLSIPHGDDYAEISARGLRVMFEEYAKYGLPMMVTENGMADADDYQRPFYTLEHLYQVADAIRDGYDVRGYYHWTISDNFEWQYGRDYREGLFKVAWNDPNFTRTPTRTSQLFAEIAKGKRIDAALWKAWALKAYPPGVK